MKLSVSLSDEDIAVLDSYVKKSGLPSRSAGSAAGGADAALPALEEDYAEAWSEWSADEHAEAWEATAGGHRQQMTGPTLQRHAYAVV